MVHNKASFTYLEDEASAEAVRVVQNMDCSAIPDQGVPSGPEEALTADLSSLSMKPAAGGGVAGKICPIDKAAVHAKQKEKRADDWNAEAMRSEEQTHAADPGLAMSQ